MLNLSRTPSAARAMGIFTQALDELDRVVAHENEIAAQQAEIAKEATNLSIAASTRQAEAEHFAETIRSTFKL